MNTSNESRTGQASVHHLAKWAVLVAGVIFGGFFVFGGMFQRFGDPRMLQTMIDHFPAAIGLPSGALAALFIVVFLENSSGPIEFEGLGFKFKGASGPIVLWVFCFLAIAGAIKLLW